MNTSRCIVCREYQAVTICRGCQSSFCTKDFNNHRDQLNQKYDATICKREEVSSLLENNRNFDPSKIFHDINIWQETTIITVQKIAEQIREEVTEHMRKTRSLLNQHLDGIVVQQRSKEEGHIEPHLQHWNDLLDQLKINIGKVIPSIEVRTFNNMEELRNSIKICQTVIDIPRIRRASVAPHLYPRREEELDDRTDILGKHNRSPINTLPNNVYETTNFNLLPKRDEISATARSLDPHRFGFLGNLLRDPTRMITIGGTLERAMGASKKYLVVYNENDILTISTTLNERTYEWSHARIVDICYCSPNIGFILLTAKQVYIFSALNQKHHHVTAIEPDGNHEFSTCTSNEQFLLLAYRVPGTSIDQWDINTWRRVKQWKSPNTCGRSEYINRLRYCSDSSNLGMTIYSSGQLRFELRDNNLKLLLCVHVCQTGCCGFTSMPKSNWLISNGHFLYIIDQAGRIETIERKTSSTAYNDAGNVAILADKYIVLRSHKVLYFYETRLLETIK